MGAEKGSLRFLACLSPGTAQRVHLAVKPAQRPCPLEQKEVTGVL